MKVTLIHNPDAGSTDESCADEIANSIRAAGHSVVCQSCRNAGWKDALLEPGDLVAVAGGDGIVGTVAKQMIGKSVPIAVLPMGTANNIASTLGLTSLSMDDLIRGWGSARRIQLDVGTAHAPWGKQYFIEGLGLGLFTDVMSKLDARQNIDLAHLNAPNERDQIMQFLSDRLEGAAGFPGLTVQQARQMHIECAGARIHIDDDLWPKDGSSSDKLQLAVDISVESKCLEILSPA